MSKASKENKSKNLMQIVVLIIALVILILLAATATLVSLGVIELGSSNPPVKSLIDAELLCDTEIRNDYEETLSSFFVDDRSSRFDNKEGKYKLFYQMQVYRDGNKKGGVETYYVNCFVSSAKGAVTDMRYYEDRDFTGKPIRRTKGNAFGL